MWGEVGLVLSFLLYLVDQATDSLTALLLFLEGHNLEAVLTTLLITLPGLAACLLELRNMWQGKGNLLKALTFLVFCPLWALLTTLYSIHNRQWRTKALLLKTMEGFLCASPQLVLQMSLWFRGTLTGPMELVLINHGLNMTSPQYQHDNLTLFGRDYDSEERYWFGVVQISSILVSFVSVFSSVVHFNELESSQCSSIGKMFLALPFFLLTILYRAIGLALVLCFLSWWSSIILFLMFFFAFLTALCIGDKFGRSFVYGLWSFLAPVGYSRDPVAPLGYGSVETMEEEEEPVTMSEVIRSRGRSSYFLTSHLLSSLFLLGPSLVIMIVLVHRATVPGSELDISTSAIFPLSSLFSMFLPGLGLCLAISLLLVRPYHRADCAKGESLEGNIIV